MAPHLRVMESVATRDARRCTCASRYTSLSMLGLCVHFEVRVCVRVCVEQISASTTCSCSRRATALWLMAHRVHIWIYICYTYQQFNSTTAALVLLQQQHPDDQQNSNVSIITTPLHGAHYTLLADRPTGTTHTHTARANRVGSEFWSAACVRPVLRARVRVFVSKCMCVCARGISTRRVGCCRLGDDYSSAVQLTCDGTEEVAQHDVVKWGVI